MKKLISIIFLFLMLTLKTFSQPGGVPSDPSLGGTNHPVGSGGTGHADLTDGLYILILCSSIYGIYYYVRKKDKIIG